MLIIESETGAALVPTQELKEDGKKIFYKEMSGTAREVSKEKVLAKLPATPSAEQELTREEAVAAINAYLEAKAQYPNLDEPLQRELEIWKGRIDKMPSPEDPEALARAEAIFVEAAGKAVPKEYSFKQNYSLEELSQQMDSFEKLSREFPERADEIEKMAAAWRLELEQQQAGRKKFEGRWLDPEDWEKEKGSRQAAAKAAFLGAIQIPAVSGILIQQEIFFAGLLLFVGGAFLGLSFLYHGVVELLKHRAWWKGAAWAAAGMILFSVVARAVVLAAAPSGPIHAGGLGEAKELDHLVWLQAGLKEALPAEIRLTDEEINAWWGRRLRFLPAEVTDVFAVRTEGWQVQFVDGGMTLDRPGRWLGQTLQLRHQLIFSRSEKGEDIYRVEATLGKLPLPPVVVLKTWNQWVESLLSQAQIFPGAKDVKLERLEKGAVVFSGG